MSSLLVRHHPLRRLVSAVLVLSVLLTTLGWGHPPCDGSEARHEAIATPAAHAGMDMSHIETRSGGDDTRDASGGCPDHDRHDERGAAACALAAHCAGGVMASAMIVPASQVLHLAQTAASTASRPLDAAYQPDAPPPKV